MVSAPPGGGLFVLVLLFTAILVVGCDLDVEDQEVQLRYDAADDLLDALFVYRGVTAPGSSDEEIAKAAAAALLSAPCDSSSATRRRRTTVRCWRPCGRRGSSRRRCATCRSATRDPRELR
jgi:hypothetical protein